MAKVPAVLIFDSHMLPEQSKHCLLSDRLIQRVLRKSGMGHWLHEYTQKWFLKNPRGTQTYKTGDVVKKFFTRQPECLHDTYTRWCSGLARGSRKLSGSRWHSCRLQSGRTLLTDESHSPLWPPAWSGTPASLRLQKSPEGSGETDDLHTSTESSLSLWRQHFYFVLGTTFLVIFLEE